MKYRDICHMITFYLLLCNIPTSQKYRPSVSAVVMNYQ